MFTFLDKVIYEFLPNAILQQHKEDDCTIKTKFNVVHKEARILISDDTWRVYLDLFRMLNQTQGLQQPKRSKTKCDECQLYGKNHGKNENPAEAINCVKYCHGVIQIQFGNNYQRLKQSNSEQLRQGDFLSNILQ